MCRTPRLSCTALTCLLAFAAVHAQAPRTSLTAAGRPGVLQLQPRLTLPKVLVSELIPGGRLAVPSGAWSGRATAFHSIPSSVRLTRRLPTVWRMRLADARELGRLDVRYELTAADGRPGRLALARADAAGSEVLAEVRAIPPMVVGQDADGAVVEGGVVLYLDLEAVRSAGHYTGTLTVTLNHY